ncbi:MAG: 4Fe-4S binding protein [Candidatus Jordarchaeaceae archaeon]
MMKTIIEILQGMIAGGLIFAVALIILIWVKDQTRKISILRLYVQIISSLIIFIGLIIGPFGLEQYPQIGNAPRDVLIGTNIFGTPFPDGLTVPTMACYYPSGRSMTCALWQIQSYLFPFWTAGKGWGVNYVTSGLERLIVVFGLVIVMSIILGRFFCGWICPFGLYMDLISRFRKCLKIDHWNLSKNINDALRQLSYIIIIVILLLSFIFGAENIVGMKIVSETEYGGFIYRYFTAPFCQVCPMKPLCIMVEGAFGYMNFQYVLSQTTGLFYEIGYYVTSLNILVLILVTVSAFAIRRFWCRLCPLGGLIAIFSRFIPFKWASIVRLYKEEEKCTKCGICKRVCPPQVTEMYEEKGGDVTVSGCILCFRCIEMCPYEDCLKITAAGKTVISSRNWLSQTR